jgi:hypothetical protein
MRQTIWLCGRLLALCILFALASACSALPVARIQSQMLWYADPQAHDLSPWETNEGGGVFNTGTGTATVDGDVKHNSDAAIRLTITQADGKHGNQAVRLFRWEETHQHQQAYFSVWYLFPQRYRPAEYWNVFQWKSKTQNSDDPFWILNVGNRPDGKMYFYLYDWQHGKSYVQDEVDIAEGQWIHVEAFYRIASDNTGHVTFWQDGVELFDVPNVQTRYADGDAQWSVNNYTDNISPATATIYVSDPVISRVRLEALDNSLLHLWLEGELFPRGKDH